MPGILGAKQAQLLEEAEQVGRGASRPSVLPGWCPLLEVCMVRVALTAGQQQGGMHGIVGLWSGYLDIENLHGFKKKSSFWFLANSQDIYAVSDFIAIDQGWVER